MAFEKKYYKRGFLNEDEGMTAFESDINSYQREDGTMAHIDAEFSITDCSRKVELEFGIYRTEDIKKQLAKADLLIEELKIFRAVLAKAAKNMKDK